MKHRKSLSILLALTMLLALVPAFTLTAHAEELNIDDVHFPDHWLQDYVKVNFDTDHNGTLSDAEIAAAKKIEIIEDGLSSLEGIGFFPELEELNCSGYVGKCSLSFVDLSQNPKLTYVALAQSDIAELDLSANPLVKTLWCDNNEFLTSVNLTGCDQLAYLHAFYTALTELDISSSPTLVDVYLNGTKTATGTPEYWKYEIGTKVVEIDPTVTVITEKVTVSFDANGGSGAMADETVPKGATFTLPDCGFEAPAGKFFDSWDAGAVGDTITVDADMTIQAQWKDLLVWNISFDAGGGSGTMEGATVVVGTKYTLPECSFTAPEGKVFDKWEQGAPGDEIDVDADLSVVAVWKDKPAETWAITFDADGGTGEMAATTVAKGEKYKLPACTFTAPEGKEFDKWELGAPGDEVEITADTTIKALWKDKAAETWAITFDADGGTGEMAATTVAKGEKYKLPENAFTAPEGKEFDKWVQGLPGDEIEIDADTKITAMWKDKDEEKKTNPFTDVKESDYFYDAVIWAYYAEPQVTNGIGNNLFAPDSTVKRGEAVTFLWRAAGCPKPKDIASAEKFTDLTQTYYKEAIAWAVENGITKGTDDTHFSPEQTCSTAHIITFLYRTLGVGADGWYEVAYGWAQGAGVLKDMTITVAPGVNCPRCDVVLFLYRTVAK